MWNIFHCAEVKSCIYNSVIWRELYIVVLCHGMNVSGMLRRKVANVMTYNLHSWSLVVVTTVISSRAGTINRLIDKSIDF